jgi:hypothetical protein
MTISRLYLGDAFGWDTESAAKVAISQLRESNEIKTNKCPASQLLLNESVRWYPNALKFAGYIPVLNIIAGVLAITYSESGMGVGPDHTPKWIGRGVAMMFGGPLLLIVDLVKYLYDRSIVDQYNAAYPALIEAFNVTHNHTKAYWPGHPVDCILPGGIYNDDGTVNLRHQRLCC